MSRRATSAHEVPAAANDAPPVTADADEAMGSPASLRSGRVHGAVDDYLSVDLGQRRVLARRATSCLVEPTAGDRVLVAEEEGQAFVLAILERPEAGPVTIAAGGDLELSPRGKLVVTAPAGVHLATARDLTLSARAMELVADEGSLVWKAARVASRTLAAEVAKLELVSEESTSVVGRLVSRARKAFRFVEGTETVRAGQVDVVAETGLRMHGTSTVVTAADLVKVDGKQIQLG